MQQHGRTTRRVLVVGGGIAGFAMMRALDQRGISAVLVDRRDGPLEAGLGLNLPGNAVRALRDPGVAEGLNERGVPIRRREYRTHAIDCYSLSMRLVFWDVEADSICAFRGDVLELLHFGISTSGLR
jgi:2-polyprenyl-6-methoxyphenol hydroxylase-like FAD-dependent oxidoreductase